MNRDVMNGERAIARDDHDAVKNGFVVQGDGIGSHNWFSPRNVLAKRGRYVVLESADTIERQSATHGQTKIDEGLLADGTSAHLLHTDHAWHACGNGRDLFRGTGWRDIGKGIDRASPQAPTRHADQNRHDERRHRVRPRQSEMDPKETDQNCEG